MFLCDPPCNNGVCIDDNTCACSTGYSGELCDVPIITECDVNPCQNGGNCSTVAVTPVCDCPDDFGGPRCEIPCNFFNFSVAIIIYRFHYVYSTEASC